MRVRTFRARYASFLPAVELLVFRSLVAKLLAVDAAVVPLLLAGPSPSLLALAVLVQFRPVDTLNKSLDIQREVTHGFGPLPLLIEY